MPIGSDERLEAPFTPTGILERIALTIFGIIGAAISVSSSSAAAFAQQIRKIALERHPNTPLSADAAVVAALKSAVSRGEAESEAALTGVDRARFNALYESAGNPPGPQELLAGWRRGIIDQSRMHLGLRQGFTRNDWSDFFDALRHEPVSTVEYLEGAVQGHIDVDVAIEHADRNGVSAVDARMIYETLGNPPGVEQMLHLWNRGIMSEAQVEQGIKESRYKNKYIDAIKRLREYLPPPRTITTLLTHGAIDQTQAQELFVKAGLTPELARAYTVSAQHSKTASHKELAASQVQALYVDRMLSRVEAVDDLGKIGYAAAEANLVLDLADRRAEQKIKNATVSKLRTLYVAHRVSRADIEADLSKLGVTPDQAAHLLDLWTLEQTIPTRTLTVGQLNSAFKKQLISRDEFVTRAVGLGYTTDDANLLADIDVPPTA